MNKTLQISFNQERYLLLSHTWAFYKILKEYSEGKIDKTMFMNHIKTYLEEWDRIKKRGYKNG